MIPDGNYKVASISKIEDLGGENALMSIKFEGSETETYYFGIHAETLRFLNQEVIVSFRQELIKGTIRQVVNTFAIPTKIVALDRERNIKLFVDELPETESNVIFDDIEMGTTYLNAVVYCSFHKYDSSSRANWSELTIMDKKRNVSKVKLFDPESKVHDFVGNYVKMDLRKNEYGFNTKDVYLVEGLNLNPNPEVELARTFIMETIEDDKALMDFVMRSKLLNSLSRYIDKDESEVGYMMVRVAMELAQARELKNSSPIVDTQLLIRGILARRAYCLTYRETSNTSKHIISVMECSKYGGSMLSAKLLSLIDVEPKVDLLEVALLNSIQSLVGILIDARKFGRFTLSKDKRWG